MALNHLKQKVVQRGDLPHISVKDQLDCIDQLSQFKLGRVLLEKRSIDTYWTDFITAHSGEKRNSNLEDFVLNRSPFAMAWRELLQKFKTITQERLEDNKVLASIPCGAMREFLELDYSRVSHFTLIGIDIDPDSLSLSRHLAEKVGLAHHVKLYQEDAWQLPFHSEIDLITSCGLNIYVSDRQRVLALYRQFFQALVPGGELVIGFLTYPPHEQKTSEWILEKISPEDLFLERVIYRDILDLQCNNFRTSVDFGNDLKEAGFSEVFFHYDHLHVFPTVVARK